jgi:hypothetical protein
MNPDEQYGFNIPQVGKAPSPQTSMCSMPSIYDHALYFRTEESKESHFQKITFLTSVN